MIFREKMAFKVPFDSPLTTTDKIFSDSLKILSGIPRIKKKIKGFCMIFFSSGCQDIKNFRFFEFFDSVDLFFIQYLWADAPKFLELESVSIFL